MYLKKAKKILLPILVIISVVITGCGDSFGEQKGENSNTIVDGELSMDTGLSNDTEENEEFDIDEIFGEFHGFSTNVMGVEYWLYDNHVASVQEIEEEYATIQEEVEVDGIKYSVVALGNVHENWKEFEIPANIKYILAGAFSNSKIRNLTIPDTVEYISGCGTFENSEIESFSFPAGVKTDKEMYMFSGCKNLKYVEIPYGVEAIGGFSGTAITSINIPESVVTIQSNAFEGCEFLKEIKIPNTVTKIEDAFQGCVLLEEITIPESVAYLDVDFVNGTKISEIIIPDTVKEYGGNNLIDDMPNLKKVKCSNNVEDIMSFSECPKLELVILPDCVKDVDCIATTTANFENVITLQVPKNTVDYFKHKFPEYNVIEKES